MPGPSKIYPTLYIGDLSDASDTDNLFDIGITHILSVGAPVEEKDEDLVYLTISVLDMEDQNILKHFEPAFKFIERARNGGGSCLVHCNAGISRAAAICIAYVMKKFKLTLQDATETISDVRPAICPNPGFVRQLEQYYLNLNPSLAPKNLESTETVESAPSTPVTSTQQPQNDPASAAVSEPSTEPSMPEVKMIEKVVEKNVYCCRSCRRPLFTMDDLMPHQISRHDIAYHKRDKKNATSSDQVICSSHFLQEPLQWMGAVDENEGKIACNKCQSRVGFWKWDGLQCSCGTWVTPAIQIAKNRVDERIMPVTISVPEDSV